MNNLEEVRQVVIGAFKTAHGVSYSTTLVNYPNFVVVDLERQEDPFVSLELSIKPERAAVGEMDTWIEGTVSVIYYFREGQGSSGAYEYTDMLNNSLAMETINDVYYDVIQPFNVVSFPGWKGVMNEMKFKVVDGPC